MTYIKSNAAAPRLQLLPTATAASTIGAPLAVPATTVDQVILNRVITSATSDFLFSANQTGRAILYTFVNDPFSTNVLTIQAATGETVSHPVQGTGLTVTLQPGETLTLENKTTTAWTFI